MKTLYRSFLASLYLILSQNLIAQMPLIHWKKTLGGTSDDIILSTKPTSDGGYILGGVTSSKDGDVSGFRGGGSDLWVVKLTSSGNLQWQKPLGGGNIEKGTIVSEAAGGGYLIGGTTSSGNGDVKNYKGGASDIWVVKLNNAGGIVWQRSLGGSSEDYITSLKPTPDGGCIVGGVVSSSNGDVTGYHGGKDIWVAKLSGTGALQWQKALGSNGSETVQDMHLQSDGSIVVLGRVSNVTMGGDLTVYYGSVDLWLSKLSSSGVLLWERTLGGSGLENWAALRATSDGGSIIGSGSNSPDGDVIGLGGDFGFWVVKLNSNGQIQWQWSDPLSENLYDLRQTADGGYIIAGNGTNGSVTAMSDAVFVKLNSTGSLIWKRSYGGSLSDEAYVIQEDAGGNFISIATTQSKELPGFHQISGTQQWPDVWVIKLDASGNKIADKCYGGSAEDWVRASAGSTHTLLSNSEIGLISPYIDRCINDDGSIFFGVSTNSKDGDVSGLHTTRTSARNDIWFVKLNPFAASRDVVSKEIAPTSELHLVYPNPAQSQVQIAFNSSLTSQGEVRIFDVKGLLLRNFKINTTKGQRYTLPVDLSAFPAGLYQYRIVNGSYRAYGKFLKSN